MASSNYKVTVFWSEEDGEYIATSSAFPTVAGFGSTEEEAVADFDLVLPGVIEVYKRKGWGFPEPQDEQQEAK